MNLSSRRHVPGVGLVRLGLVLLRNCPLGACHAAPSTLISDGADCVIADPFARHRHARGTAAPTLAAPTRTPLPPPPARQAPTLTVCQRGCGYTTLRAALANIEAVEGAVVELGDPVHIEAGTVIDRDVTIQGAGSDATYLQAAASLEESSDRVLHISPGVSVTLRDLSIRYGHPSASPYAGGGIWNEGDLMLIDTLVTENLAGDGGGILNRGRLTIYGGGVIDNIADGQGTPGIRVWFRRRNQ